MFTKQFNLEINSDFDAEKQLRQLLDEEVKTGYIKSYAIIKEENNSKI